MTGTRVERSGTTVADVRHSPVVTIRAADTLWDAWQVMFVSSLRHLAVVDDEGASAGVVSDRSILSDLPLTEEHLSGRHVADVMASPGAVTDATPTQEAASIMSRYAVDALPIVSSDGRPIAMLTAGDLVAWVARD